MRALHGFSLLSACALTATACGDSATEPAPAVNAGRNSIPSHDELRAALRGVLEEQNGGLDFEMWATVVDRSGRVIDVVFSGVNRDDQWPGSRVISAQKANTANAFTLEGFALSSANLFAAVQPGGSLYGLQESNPVDPDVAYAGAAGNFGTERDPMIRKRIGGINVFGGGLGLYTSSGNLVGGLGVSGDTSCTDHIIAWKLRHAINLDNVPAGPAGPTGETTDNIIFSDDDVIDGFEHARCFDLEGTGNHEEIAEELPESHPVGPAE